MIFSHIQRVEVPDDSLVAQSGTQARGRLQSPLQPGTVPARTQPEAECYPLAPSEFESCRPGATQAVQPASNLEHHSDHDSDSNSSGPLSQHGPGDGASDSAWGAVHRRQAGGSPAASLTLRSH